MQIHIVLMSRAIDTDRTKGKILVIEGGEIRKRKKKPSKKVRDDFDTLPYLSRKTYPGNAAD